MVYSLFLFLRTMYAFWTPYFSQAKAVWVMSAMSIVGSIFRVALGWIADMKFINRRVLFCAANFLCAFAVSSLYLCGNYESIVPVCIIYSISSGTYGQTIRIATLEYVPSDKCVITKTRLFINILKVSAPKAESFQIKILIFFIFPLKT